MKNSKYLLVLSTYFALSLVPISLKAQFEVGIGYLNSNPKGMMGNFIHSPAHGLSADFAYQIPNTKFTVGLQFASSNYGIEKREESYRFNNGYEGNVRVEVFNSFTNNNLYFRYDILDQGFTQPYLFLGAGFTSFSTELVIIDPREEFTSDCPKPLERSTLLNDRATNLVYGGGMRFDLGYPIKSLQKNKTFLDFRIGYLNGGQVSYLNVNQPNNPINSNIENVGFDFVSESQPDVVHRYFAGTSYRTKMQFLTLNASIIIVLGNRKGQQEYSESYW